MDKTQASFPLPRRLPRQPKAALYPAEIAAEALPLAPKVSYFTEDNGVDAPVPSESAPNVAPPLPAENKRQKNPTSADIVPSTQITDSASREQAVAEAALLPASELRQDRPSRHDPKPGYARPAGPSRSRPSRPSGLSAAVLPSASVPAVREARSHGASETQQNVPLRVSAGHSASIASPQLRQDETESMASRQSIPAFRDDAGISQVPASRQANRPSRRVARKRKMSAGIALTVLSCILVAYSFSIGSIENEMDRLVASSDSMPAFLKSMLPWLPLLPLILLLGTVLWILAGMIGLRRTKHREETSATNDEQVAQKRETKRRRAPLELFRDQAEKEGIGKDAAYQAWRLLQMYGPDSHILSVYDDLHTTLSMTPQQIQSVYQQLAPSAERTVSARSVLDLMRVANSPQYAARQKLRR